MVRSQSTTVKSQSTTARSQRVQRVTSQRKMSKLSRTMKSHTPNLIPKMEKKMLERERKAKAAKAAKVAKVAKAAKAARARRMVTSQKKLPKPKREDAEDPRVVKDPRATTMAKDPAQKVTSQRDHPRMT